MTYPGQNRISSSEIIMDKFSECAPWSALAREYYFNGAAPYHMERIAGFLGITMLGTRVEVQELEKGRTRGERPITVYSAGNPRMNETYRSGILEDVRTYEGDDHEYLPQMFIPHRKKVRGTVAGVDIKHNSLVLQPRNPTRLFNRYWVTMVSDEGEPLVELRITGWPDARGRSGGRGKV